MSINMSEWVSIELAIELVEDNDNMAMSYRKQIWEHSLNKILTCSGLLPSILGLGSTGNVRCSKIMLSSRN